MGHHRGVQPTGESAVLKVRMAAEPVCVSGARRFVSDGLRSLGRAELEDDATLCVSELAGNAVLHSGTRFMEIALTELHRGVRISVEDDGPTPAHAVVPRAGVHASGTLLTPDLEDEPTTGRGLAIVSVLASDWGVVLTEAGKRIWADLSGGDTEHDVRPPTGGPQDSSPAPSEAPALPPGWGLVRLAGCPVHLSLRQDQHLDELVDPIHVQLAGRTFVSQHVEGHRLVPGTEIRLVFTDDLLVASAGCNTMRSGWSEDGSEISWDGDPASTLIGCPPELAGKDSPA
jgi:anti-sigma regulatory factor (Ser/Thr protein kinase)